MDQEPSPLQLTASYEQTSPSNISVRCGRLDGVPLVEQQGRIVLCLDCLQLSVPVSKVRLGAVVPSNLGFCGNGKVRGTLAIHGPRIQSLAQSATPRTQVAVWNAVPCGVYSNHALDVFPC